MKMLVEDLPVDAAPRGNGAGADLTNYKRSARMAKPFTQLLGSGMETPLLTDASGRPGTVCRLPASTTSSVSKVAFTSMPVLELPLVISHLQQALPEY
jgi:hypothetical protein